MASKTVDGNVILEAMEKISSSAKRAFNALTQPSSSGVCLQCHRKFFSKDQQLCSQLCAHNYWQEYRKYCQTTAGKTDDQRTPALFVHKHVHVAMY